MSAGKGVGVGTFERWPHDARAEELELAHAAVLPHPVLELVDARALRAVGAPVALVGARRELVGVAPGAGGEELVLLPLGRRVGVVLCAEGGGGAGGAPRFRMRRRGADETPARAGNAFVAFSRPDVWRRSRDAQATITPEEFGQLRSDNIDFALAIATRVAAAAKAKREEERSRACAWTAPSHNDLACNEALAEELCAHACADGVEWLLTSESQKPQKSP